MAADHHALQPFDSHRQRAGAFRFKTCAATGRETIVFLYKLAQGPCPKSYGLHVAELAGVPASVCSVAATVGDAFETSMAQHFRGAAEPIATDDKAAAESDGDLEDEDAMLLPWLQQILRGGDEELVQAHRHLQRLLPALGM